MVVARSKGGSKGGELPDVSVDGTAEPVVNESVSHVSEAAAAPVRDPLAEIDRLRRETASVSSTATGGAAAAAVAIIMAFTVPLWGSQIVVNDVQSQSSAALAVAHLHNVTASAAPFATDLALAKQAISPKYTEFDEALSGMAGVAKTGAPTKAELSKMFAGMADQVLVGKVVAKNDGWASWAAHKAASVVRIESVVNALTPKSISPVETKIVHDAEAALNDGDLAKAVETLSKLDGNAAEIVAPWLSSAKDRLTIDAKMAKLKKMLDERASVGAYLSFN